MNADGVALEGYSATWALDMGEFRHPLRVTRLHAPEAATMPSSDEVLLWVDTSRADIAVEPGAAAAALDSETLAAIYRLWDPRDRMTALAAHANLRIALGTLLGSRPHDLRFDRGRFGKPRLRGDETVHFSLSHTRGATGFALARRPVGFDVERALTLVDMAAVAQMAFAVEMRAAFAAAPASARAALFYRFWTLGEAYIKATGLGLSQDLQSFAFAADDPPRLIRTAPEWGPPARWRLGVL